MYVSSRKQVKQECLHLFVLSHSILKSTHKYTIARLRYFTNDVFTFRNKNAISVLYYLQRLKIGGAEFVWAVTNSTLTLKWLTNRKVWLNQTTNHRAWKWQHLPQLSHSHKICIKWTWIRCELEPLSIYINISRL